MAQTHSHEESVNLAEELEHSEKESGRGICARGRSGRETREVARGRASPRAMNASACAELLERVPWDDLSLLASLLVLGVIDVMVVVGNCLVIAAVFMSSKLRSVTNLFIVSLAVADLMVGVAVLPFSAMWEVFKVSSYWLFNLIPYSSLGV
ncbi:hypothetical protein PR048_019683 [Dryococelus australis]|uniref:G-protein coupled receptors family 1 profile domain-containing protein n=1 Tax=Dryococelus australis TaxID=614101 RepID=A0ABQ9H453_9NEOP|nr:hypothetical protein PR048_019683 [Dryococelus australis]